MRHWVIVATAILIAGCSSNDTSCVVDDDCFKGEACVDEVCQGASNSNTASNTSNNTSSNTPNNENNGTSNATSNATSNSNSVSNISGVCRDDPFTAMCEPDDNDSFGDYIMMESGRGCSGSNDFEGGMVEVLDQTMCPLESVDKYSTNLLPCDDIIFVVEVTVTPKQDCDPGDWDFNMRLQGNDCIEHNDKMRCEDLPDGSKRATGFLEPSISIAIPYIDITALKENMRFDYDIKLVTRE